MPENKVQHHDYGSAPEGKDKSKEREKRSTQYYRQVNRRQPGAYLHALTVEGTDPRVA